MQKRINGLDEKMLSLVGDDADESKDMPTRRAILRMIGNVKADSADEARRTTRIVGKLREKTLLDLILESDDLNFMLKKFEGNQMGLVAWMQGQIIEIIESAEKYDPK